MNLILNSPLQHSTKWKLSPCVKLNKTISETGHICKPSSGTSNTTNSFLALETQLKFQVELEVCHWCFFGKVSQHKQS